jgi:glycosidase
VDRVASSLKNPAHLLPLYTLFFSLPGIPSLYYGSEFGLQGRRTPSSDRELRPDLDLEALRRHPPQPGLADAIARLAHIRQASPALSQGNYQPLHVDHRVFAFLRQQDEEKVVVAVSCADHPVQLTLRLPFSGSHLADLASGERVPMSASGVELSIAPNSGATLKAD